MIRVTFQKVPNQTSNNRSWRKITRIFWHSSWPLKAQNLEVLASGPQLSKDQVSLVIFRLQAVLEFIHLVPSLKCAFPWEVLQSIAEVEAVSLTRKMIHTSSSRRLHLTSIAVPWCPDSVSWAPTLFSFNTAVTRFTSRPCSNSKQPLTPRLRRWKRWCNRALGMRREDTRSTQKRRIKKIQGCGQASQAWNEGCLKLGPDPQIKINIEIRIQHEIRKPPRAPRTKLKR